MRSARMVLATATATAALAIAAPAAFADYTGDGDHDKSSYSKEHEEDSKHDKPHGGMHTGGGALTSVNEGDEDKEYTLYATHVQNASTEKRRESVLPTVHEEDRPDTMNTRHRRHLP